MRTIYKYEVAFNDVNLIDMPADSKIVHVGTTKGDKIFIWAEAPVGEAKETRRFDVVGTGHIILRSDATHLGTVAMSPNVWGEIFVWHVYEVPMSEV